MISILTEQIAATAARLVVEEGMEYGPAKRRAAQLLGRRSARANELPDNQVLEDEVRAYLALFCADTQPAELAELRRVAAQWMERLAAFRPHLTGAVWRGTATRLNNVHLQLYCDDSKQAELTLLDEHVAFDVGSLPGPRGLLVDVLTVTTSNRPPGGSVTIHLTILDHDDLRGGLKPDARGKTARGDLVALRKLMVAS